MLLNTKNVILQKSGRPHESESKQMEFEKYIVYSSYSAHDNSMTTDNILQNYLIIYQGKTCLKMNT